MKKIILLFALITNQALSLSVLNNKTITFLKNHYKKIGIAAGSFAGILLIKYLYKLSNKRKKSFLKDKFEQLNFNESFEKSKNSFNFNDFIIIIQNIKTLADFFKCKLLFMIKKENLEKTSIQTIEKNLEEKFKIITNKNIKISIKTETFDPKNNATDKLIVENIIKKNETIEPYLLANYKKIPEVMELHLKDESTYKNILQSFNHNETHKAFIENIPVGIFKKEKDDDGSLAVDPNYRAQGIGTALIIHGFADYFSKQIISSNNHKNNDKKIIATAATLKDNNIAQIVYNKLISIWQENPELGNAYKVFFPSDIAKPDDEDIINFLDKNSNDFNSWRNIKNESGIYDKGFKEKGNNKLSNRIVYIIELNKDLFI